MSAQGARPEVLAPAGSPEALEAAARGGADAAYLGAGQFSARAHARNFSREELRDAVRFCHARGMKAYLALNTLLSDRELPQALEWAAFAASLPVDGVIVQDWGLARALARRAPGLRRNASTQCSAHTPAAVRALRDMGFARVVLARELSKEEMEEIAAQAPGVELECFVHGALCMCVSGQCYFSAMLGSRSGNRGQCAQPCRLPFSAPGGTGRDLSLKDLSLLPRAAELRGCGVQSWKIEGRMKRPEYVAAAARAYRLASEGKDVPPALSRALAAVFSREGFTSGYFDGRRGRAMFGARSKEDAEHTAEALAYLRELTRQEPPRAAVDFSLTVRAGEPCRLLACDGERAAEARGPVPEPARARPLDAARCRAQLEKTGGTFYAAREVSCEVEEGLSLPVSALNALRREALGALTRLREERPPVPFDAAPEPPAPPHRAGPLTLRARFPDAARVPENAGLCAWVYLPATRPDAEFSALLARGLRVAAELPRGLFGREAWAKGRLRALRALGVEACRAGTLDGAAIVKECGAELHGGFSMNLFNTGALLWAEEFGFASAELSPELTLAQAAALGGALPRGAFAYGRLPLMLTRNCPAANGPGGCRGCETPPELTDRLGVRFPIVCGGGCSETLNSAPVYLADRLGSLQGVDFALLYFSVENSVETGEILARYAGGGCPEKPPFAYTRGLSARGVK